MRTSDDLQRMFMLRCRHVAGSRGYKHDEGPWSASTVRLEPSAYEHACGEYKSEGSMKRLGMAQLWDLGPFVF